MDSIWKYFSSQIGQYPFDGKSHPYIQKKDLWTDIYVSTLFTFQYEFMRKTSSVQLEMNFETTNVLNSIVVTKPVNTILQDRISDYDLYLHRYVEYQWGFWVFLFLLLLLFLFCVVKFLSLLFQCASIRIDTVSLVK